MTRQKETPSASGKSVRVPMTQTVSEQDELRMKQIRADHAWGFCQSMGVKNLDISTEKGSKVTLVELLSEYRNEAMRTLASGMRKVLTPEELKDLAYACDPLGSFLKDLCHE